MRTKHGRKNVLSRCSIIAFCLAIVWTASANANVCVMKRVSVPKVCGQVLDSSGEPIRRAEVAVVGKDKKTIVDTETNAEGEFDLGSILVGDYQLNTRVNNFANVQWPTTVTKRSEGITCERPIYVVLAPNDFCASRVTMKKPKFKHAKTY